MHKKIIKSLKYSIESWLMSEKALTKKFTIQPPKNRIMIEVPIKTRELNKNM